MTADESRAALKRYARRRFQRGGTATDTDEIGVAIEHGKTAVELLERVQERDSGGDGEQGSGG